MFKKVPQYRLQGYTDAWELRNVREICRISTGKSNTQDREEQGKFPFYVRSPIIEKSTKYLFDEEAVLTVGDGVGTGKVFHYVHGKYDLHQRVYRMFSFTHVNAKYFYYYFSKKFFDRVMAMTAKNSVDSVRLEMISDMEITIPQLEEQEKIVKILSTLDQQITLHQRKLDMLKEQKKTYLKLLFPAKGQTKPVLRFQGFEDDWEKVKLGEIGETFTGLSGKTKEDFGHGEGKFITYVNVFNNPISDLLGTDRIEVDESQTNVQFGDIFFTTSSETPEEVGMASVWLGNGNNIYLNSFCFGFRPTLKLSNHFMAYVLRSTEIRKKFIFLAQGISRYNISKTKVMNISIPLPTLPEQESIGTFFQTLDQEIAQVEDKLASLKEMKKTLLRKLFV